MVNSTIMDIKDYIMEKQLKILQKSRTEQVLNKQRLEQ